MVWRGVDGNRVLRPIRVVSDPFDVMVRDAVSVVVLRGIVVRYGVVLRGSMVSDLWMRGPSSEIGEGNRVNQHRMDVPIGAVGGRRIRGFMQVVMHR